MTDMTAKRSERPTAEADYHVYYEDYVARVPDGDIAFTLERQLVDTIRLLESVPEDRETYAYAEGKWSIRQVVAHLRDTEAMFAGRILWFARQPAIEQAGMDQDLWVQTADVADRPLSDLMADLRAVRGFTVQLVKSIPESAWGNRGIASEYEVALSAIPWIIAGHERAHRSGLKRNYGVGGE